MKITVVNRGLAKKLEADSGMAVISICSRNDVHPQLSPKFGACCKLKFDDWDVPPMGLCVTLFDEKMAAEILDFMDFLVAADTFDELVVHCDAGISRSPGVAVALNEIYNCVKIIPPPWRLYNRLVYRTLLNVNDRRAQCKKSKTIPKPQQPS